MLDKSFFVSTEVKQCEVALPDGKKHQLYFKELTAVDISRFASALQSADDEVRATANSKLIALSLCDADGKSSITLEQALQLKGAVVGPLVEAITAVNGLGEQKND